MLLDGIVCAELRRVLGDELNRLRGGEIRRVGEVDVIAVHHELHTGRAAIVIAAHERERLQLQQGKM